jgi:hypothetical protein
MKKTTNGSKKTSNGSNKSQNQIRMDDELKERIGKYQQYLLKTTSLEVSFSASVRSLLDDALTRFEKAH